MHVCNLLFHTYFLTILVTWMSLCDAFIVDLLGSNDDDDGVGDKIQMIFYEGLPKSSIRSFSYKLYHSNSLMSRIDLKKPYVLYIHGFEEHPSNESCRTIVSAYLQRGTDNIVLLDWSELAFDNYVTVYLRIKDIARHTAAAIENLVNGGLNVDAVHIVGHSMGAQVAGFIGQFLEFELPRVTGLDPANPLFYQFGSDHINPKSARQVDIVHTDGGLYGAFEATGSIDFFPNGGVRPQPGCSLFGLPLSPRALCSHWRSWRFYAESVINNEAFPAVKCDSYGSFLLGHCLQNDVIYMGYALPKDSSGSFFLVTNNASRFGRGMNGIENLR